MPSAKQIRLLVVHVYIKATQSFSAFLQELKLCREATDCSLNHSFLKPA